MQGIYCNSEEVVYESRGLYCLWSRKNWNRTGKSVIKNGKKVVMIWDRNPKKEGVYQGIPIRNPYKEKELVQENKRYQVIIGLANSLENEKIYQYLCKEGYKKVYPYLGG